MKVIDGDKMQGRSSKQKRLETVQWPKEERSNVFKPPTFIDNENFSGPPSFVDLRARLLHRFDPSSFHVELKIGSPSDEGDKGFRAWFSPCVYQQSKVRMQ